MPRIKINKRGQTALEYLLIIVVGIMIVVAVLVWMQGTEEQTTETAKCAVDMILCANYRCPDCPSDVCGVGGGCHPLGTCLPGHCGFSGTICGDLNIDPPDEECDDGNDDDTDDCIDCKNAYCGDGFVWSGTEQCDGANADACPGQCIAPGQPGECTCPVADPCATCECDACEGCTFKLNNCPGCSTVTLTQDIESQGSTCIDIQSGKTFDCDNHKVSHDTGAIGTLGVRFTGDSNAGVENCVLENWHMGIRLFDCDNNVITGNTIVGGSPGSGGIILEPSSDNNVITWNTVTDCKHQGILLVGSSLNNVTNNVANSNVHGFVLSDGCSGNVLSWNTANENGWIGFGISASDGNTFLNNAANSNQEGFYIGCTTGGDCSDNNVFEHNKAESNTDYGFHIACNGGSCPQNNPLSYNDRVCGNNKDIVMQSGAPNSGDDNTCDTVQNWNDTGTIGCTNPCS